MEEIERKLIEASNLLTHTKTLLYSHSPVGFTKLVNKIKAEIRFLEKVHDGRLKVEPCHLVSSNIKYLKALVDCVEDIGVGEICSIFQPMHFVEHDDKYTIHVDLVTNNGACWVKVIARNPASLLLVAQGQEQYGEKTLLDIAKEYVLAADTNPVSFRSPSIMFHFATGVPEQLSYELIDMGIKIHGDLIDDKGCVTPSSDKLSSVLNELKSNDSRSASSGSVTTQVNLDITALITLISNLSNGHCNYTYDIPALSQQAEQERFQPALPPLQDFLENKSLIACQTCIDAFKDIISTIGGAREKQRADKLLQRIKVVPDSPSERSLSLHNSGKINKRGKIIFGTGDSLQAITVTANKGFVRAASQSGVLFSIFEHEPRALTEIKEKPENLLEVKKT